MSYTYEWANAEKTTLKRTAEDGSVAWVPTDPANRDYAEFKASKARAKAYKAPPAPPEPTPEEKLAASGLTVDELKALLGL